MILSNEYANKVLDLFRGFPIEKIEKFYLGLILDNGDEVSGASYARIEYDASPIAWLSTQETVGEASNGTSRKITNVATISWSTILEDWGQVERIRFFTSPNGIDYLGDTVIPSTLIQNGDVFEILVSEFEIKA